MTPKQGTRVMFGILAAVLALVAIQRVLWMRSASAVSPLPTSFVNAPTLSQAEEKSRTDNRPVLVFATADWCGPCQVLKRTTLAETEVTDAIERLTHPTLLDITIHDPNAEKLSIDSVPALILMKNGQELARLEGIASTEEVLAFLDQAKSAPTP